MDIFGQKGPLLCNVLFVPKRFTLPRKQPNDLSSTSSVSSGLVDLKIMSNECIQKVAKTLV